MWTQLPQQACSPEARQCCVPCCVAAAGAGQISGSDVSHRHAVVLGPGDHLTATAAATAAGAAATAAATAAGTAAEAAAGGGESAGDAFSVGLSGRGLKFLLMAGAPINEPIVQHG